MRISPITAPALFRRRPRFFYRPRSDPIVPPEAREEFPELREALDFLSQALEPEFDKCDMEALRQQNRYRRQQLFLLVAGATGAVLATVQAALTRFSWPGVLLALVGALSGVFAQRAERGGALQKYLDQRTRAERLRSLYFQYVVAVDRYAGDQRRQRLRDDVEAILTKDTA
jgi:hypothetical protein